MRFSAGTVCTPRPSVWCSAGVSDRPHSTEDDLYTVVRAEIGAISRQAVYDTLAALTDKGLSGASSRPGRRAATRTGSVTTTTTTTTTSSAESATGWSTSTVRSATPRA
jgi:hypothetical protein